MKETEQQACSEGYWSQNPEPESEQKVGSLPPVALSSYPLLSTLLPQICRNIQSLPGSLFRSGPTGCSQLSMSLLKPQLSS